MISWQWLCSHWAEFCSTLGEWHSLAYGFMLLFTPWNWFDLDECWVPKHYPYDVRLAIYDDYHYYVFGMVIAVCFILLMIALYFLILRVV